MGRKPKSLKELELSGALKARPARYAKRIEAEKAKSEAQIAQPAPIPAKPLSLGSAPKWLGPDEKAIWKELSKTYPNLIHSDRFHLEIAVKLTHKLRTAEGGLKGQEYSQLLGILDRFAPKDGPAPIAVTSPESIPVTNPEPVEDNRTPQEIAWDEFVAEDEEFNRRDKLVRAEMENSGRDYMDVKHELFPDEAEAYRKMLADNSAWIEERRAAGLWTDDKPKVEEKVEYTPPPVQRVEPMEMDPARKQELLLSRWSM